MIITGELRKMPAHLNKEGIVDYILKLYHSKTNENTELLANELIGRNISINYTGNIYCKRCKSLTKTSYFQGFCYSCYINAPEATECIINPEKCRAHLGEGRDPDWEKLYHNRPHVVYLAASDRIKVGVTGELFPVTRWIDQGASSAIILAETPNRYLSGMIEVALKSSFADKTNWRNMLKNNIDESIDLEETKWQLEEMLPEDISQYITDNNEITEIHYPILEYPEKVNSINLERKSHFSGRLMGIKGQYFIFDKNRVMNMRSHEGYEVTIGIN